MKRLNPLIVVTAIGAFTFAAPLLADLKGGERLNAMNTPKARIEATGAKMNCPVETRSTVDKSARGAFKSVSVYTAHLCPSCETKETTKGAGKLATRELEHSCKQAISCCNTKS
jgi:hypothetical protein